MAKKDLERYFRWVSIPLVGIILAFLFSPGSIPTMGRVLKAITITFVFWQGALFIVKLYRKKYPLIKQTKKRLVLTLFFAAIYITISNFLLNYTFDLFFPELKNNSSSLLDGAIRHFFVPVIIGLIYELSYLFTRLNITTIEAEKLRGDQTVAQLDSLKNQISPHFLFNSLNTLITLISENQQYATEFAQKLSSVYRYILEYKEKELVSLETELNFIRSYIHLLKMRYPENLTIEYQIKEGHMSFLVAPLSIQMLIENILKHNIISKSKPLHIDIYTEKGDAIIVKNNLQLKKSVKDSTKRGLENIKRRYQFLTNKTVEVITTQRNFMVVIPLIKSIQE